MSREHYSDDQENKRSREGSLPHRSMGSENAISSESNGGGIDLVQLIRDTLRIFFGMWWLPLILAALLSGLLCFQAKRDYRPYYKASATFTVYVVGLTGSTSTYYSQGTAEQLSKTFPTILTSGILNNLICEDLGVKSLPASINAYVEGSTALFTIETVSSDPDLAYKVLVSAIKNYPKVANYVVGNTTMTLINEPLLPSEPLNTIDYKGAVVKGCTAGLCIALLIALLLAITKKTVRGSDDLKSIINLRCIGNVPYEVRPKRLKGTFASIESENVSKNFADAIRLIRSRIEKSAKEHGEKVILFSSSIPGEGKTTTAVNTAIALAEKGNSVVLVDCDIRKPTVIGDFKNLADKGLVDYLLDGCKLSEILSECGGLSVINGKRTANNAAELFKTNAMTTLISELRKRFDFVILDSPPCAIMADAQAIAQCSDSIVYIVCQDYTRKSHVIDGIRNLANCDKRFIGYILNNASSTGSGYDYTKYARYSKYAGYNNYAKYGYGAYSKLNRDR